MISLPWALAGGAAWTASEYAIHRFVGHGPKRARARSILARLTPLGFLSEFNAEHMAHHANPSYFAPTSHKVVAAAVLVPTVAGALAPILGLGRAASFALGFTAVYGAYEVVHRRVHTHPPRGPYGRWVRRHHLTHHHKTPRANHGVTSPVWDKVFGTEQAAEQVSVPRHAAPPWMIDPATEDLRAGLERDYSLSGRRS